MLAEILKKILLNLDDRDEIVENKSPSAFRNLISCISVNREWCAHAIPILWRHPFHRCIKSRSDSLIHTLLQCLSEDELQDLYNNGFRLPLSFFESIDKFQSFAAFNYSSFLKSLDYFQLVNFVKNWCNSYMGEGENNEKNILILLRVILNHYSKRSSGLSSLNIRSNGVDDDKCMLLLEPNVQQLIRPVKTLSISCYFHIDSFVLGMSKICRNLTSMKISNLSYDNETTVSTARNLGILIESQKGLKCLQVTRCKSSITILIPAILKQRRTLKEINFRGVNFEGVHRLDILKSSKLENLIIVDSYNLDHHLIQSLGNNRKLKNVEIFNCKPENINNQLEKWAFMINNNRRKRRYL